MLDRDRHAHRRVASRGADLTRRVTSRTRRFAIASDVYGMNVRKGEAPVRIMTTTADISPSLDHAPVATSAATSWYAVWTRSRCEERVTDDLATRGFETFLPRAQAWVQHRGRRRRLSAPLFPGYLFVRHAMDPGSHAEVLRARGVVRLLGDTGGPTAIGHAEIDAVRRVTDSGLPLSRRGPVDHGDSVRIIAGPLAGLEGRFLRSRPQKGLFVIAVRILRRSVAVEVDAAFVEAV
jgi:transcription antitermination factor NusG